MPFQTFSKETLSCQRYQTGSRLWLCIRRSEIRFLLMLFVVKVTFPINDWSRHRRSATLTFHSICRPACRPELAIRSTRLMKYNHALTAALLLTFACGEASSDSLAAEKDEELSEITVTAARVANDSPASSYPTAATTFFAASVKPSAVMISTPLSARILRPSSTSVPSRRTTSGTEKPTV